MEFSTTAHCVPCPCLDQPDCIRPRGDNTTIDTCNGCRKHLNIYCGKQPRPPVLLTLKTPPRSCPAFFENDDRRLVVEELPQARVWDASVIIVLTSLTFCSKETTVDRQYEDGPRYRKGIVRLVSSPQSMSGRHQCTYQTLRCMIYRTVPRRY